jgi:hypothetical protein
LPFSCAYDTLSNGIIGLILNIFFNFWLFTSAGEGRSGDRYTKNINGNATCVDVVRRFLLP